MGAALDLHAELDLGARLNGLQKSVDDLAKSIALPVQPRRLQKSAVTPTGVAGPFVISLGSPSDPVIWDLRSLVLIGSDDHTAVANVTAAVYAGQLPSRTAEVVLTDLGWTGLTVPSSTTFNEQIVVGHKQALYLALSGTGVVAGVTFLALAVVMEVQAEDAARYFG